MIVKVHINDPLDEKTMEKLREDTKFELSVRHFEKEELIEKIKDVDVLIVRSATKVTREIIEAGSNLKMIIRAGVGLDNIDLKFAKERGIDVRNTPISSSISVAEMTIGLMLSASRWISRGDRTLKEGHWEKKKLRGFELYGKTLGIIGFGNIGVEVAKRARCFGMRVLGFDIARGRFEGQEWAEYRDLDSLLGESDYISIHLPLDEKTHHMISFEEFEKMKDGVILVNTSRGGIVDEKALYENLKSGKLRAVALDVFEVEPPFDELRRKILAMDNVVATPHIGASTVEAQRRIGSEVMKILHEFVENLGEVGKCPR